MVVRCICAIVLKAPACGCRRVILCRNLSARVPGRTGQALGLLIGFMRANLAVRTLSDRFPFREGVSMLCVTIEVLAAVWCMLVLQPGSAVGVMIRTGLKYELLRMVTNEKLVPELWWACI